MKNNSISVLLAFAGLLAASQPALAAAKKPDVRATAALVSALQAVSPDPLGGRLGLAATTAFAPVLEKSLPGRDYAAQTQRAELDQRSYLIWKSSQKS